MVTCTLTSTHVVISTTWAVLGNVQIKSRVRSHFWHLFISLHASVHMYGRSPPLAHVHGGFGISPFPPIFRLSVSLQHRLHDVYCSRSCRPWNGHVSACRVHRAGPHGHVRPTLPLPSFDRSHDLSHLRPLLYSTFSCASTGFFLCLALTPPYIDTNRYLIL
ncbi:hypothetical protein BC827DRAFT_560414 [Russula dissimulans]|nr:hypothetical protein BC827DRAFT_560414 [Russula dissimulans]